MYPVESSGTVDMTPLHGCGLLGTVSLLPPPREGRPHFSFSSPLLSLPPSSLLPCSELTHLSLKLDKEQGASCYYGCPAKCHAGLPAGAWDSVIKSLADPALTSHVLVVLRSLPSFIFFVPLPLLSPLGWKSRVLSGIMACSFWLLVLT